MLNSTVELIALWASSSPSLLAFCFSHLIIAVLFLGGRGGCASELDTDGDSRGEWTSEGAQAEPLRGVQVHGGGKINGGQEGPAATTNIIADRGRAGECVAGEGEVDAAAVQLEASGKDSGGDGESVAADASSQEKGGGDAEEDELMVRAEEFIQRMTRAWRTENVRLC
ncbi:hypothetical protein GQ55_9G542300 [Panicum hallii var. hallii]|uniref:Uncharacterized protein n=1 Tax=Panicum hallii var. hallii TaxID=1504633 RepID=A0A2T7CFA0_9POAL|nr:hypothetical protein GQ55_9G542300 [Panicum hallii var. hallii]